jgi:hypothetical protein
MDLLFAQGITPSRAQHSLKKTVPAANMPNVKKFQDRNRYFRVKELKEHSTPAEMLRMLVESHYDPPIQDTEYFSFGYEIRDGVPQVGFGGTSGVFKVGVTTKTLLRNMDRHSSTFVFHWDATYKINSLDYPILICGITDPGRNFHPVAFFVISQESTDEYVWAMRSLMKAYEDVVGLQLQIRYVMSDAAKAPAAAVMRYQSQLNVQTILMCFFHLVACVNKRLGAAASRTENE